MMWRICYQYRQYLLALGLLAGILPVTQAADDPTETFLYEQVRLGNSKSNDVLVSQSLYRLSLIKPNDPSVLLMRIQFAVKQKETAKAQQLVEQLRMHGENTEQYQRAIKLLSLTHEDNRQILQKAYLYQTAGRYDEALQLYDDIYQGTPPDEGLALEYLNVLIAANHANKMARIKQIYHTYPNNQQIANIYQQYHLTPALSTPSATSAPNNTISIRALKQQLRQQPDNADIIGTLGVRYSRGRALFARKSTGTRDLLSFSSTHIGSQTQR
ncbi:hypothetical protein ACFYLH_00745 [Proteus mirabilis]|uniref:hypothetical protein n=1 Tax=Proteus mirabilis TaxID=584 RepID=UPI001EF8F9FD|nr:hypothetical protein [Proteus mirabilis]